MAIRRTALAFEGKFVQIPNDWARDGRVSRRARGLLTEIMSHKPGWKVTVRSLVTEHEGKEAVSTALRELIDAGYLARSQKNEAGRFGEVEYEVTDPHLVTVSGKSGHGTASGFAASGSTVSGKSATKNTREKEHDVEEHDVLFDSAESNAESAAGTQLSESWSPTQRHRDLAASFGANFERELMRFKDHARRNKRRQKNWNTAFTNWLRKGAEMSQQRAASGGVVQQIHVGRPSPVDVGARVDQMLAAQQQQRKGISR